MDMGVNNGSEKWTGKNAVAAIFCMHPPTSVN